MASETVILVAAVIASLVEHTLPYINTLGLPPLDLKLQSRATQNVIGRSVLVLKKWEIPVWDEKLYSNLASPWRPGT